MQRLTLLLQSLLRASGRFAAWSIGCSFQAEPGELIVATDFGRLVGGNSRSPGRLVLTDRKLVHLPTFVWTGPYLSDYHRTDIALSDIESLPATRRQTSWPTRYSTLIDVPGIAQLELRCWNGKFAMTLHAVVGGERPTSLRR